jgi:hypothetical protein
MGLFTTHQMVEPSAGRMGVTQMNFTESNFWQNVVIAVLILPYFIGICVSAVYTNTRANHRFIRGKEQSLNSTSEVVQESGLRGRLIATCGATLLAFIFSGTSVAAIIWAISWALGLPNFILEILLALGLVPVLWATVWTAGRAWHVETLLGTGRDVDQPVFKIDGYIPLPFLRLRVPKS